MHPKRLVDFYRLKNVYLTPKRSKNLKNFDI